MYIHNNLLEVKLIQQVGLSSQFVRRQNTLMNVMKTMVAKKTSLSLDMA